MFPEFRQTFGGDGLFKGPQVYAGGDDVHLAPDAVAQQQAADFLRGSDHAVGPVGDPAGKQSHRLVPPLLNGGKIVGVVLIDRVIGMYQRDIQLLGNFSGQKEGAEFALGVNYVRAPAQQIPHIPAAQSSSQPRTGVNQPGTEGSDVGDALPAAGEGGLRQRQHPHLWPRPSSSRFRSSGGTNPVDGGAVTIE